MTEIGAPLLRAPALDPLGLVASEWDEKLPCFESLAEAVAATGAEAVVIEGPANERSERVVEALALDLHVLAFPPLSDLQRCALIAQNRGARLMVADPAVYPASEALAEAFAAYVLEGTEPPTSARRLAR